MIEPGHVPGGGKLTYVMVGGGPGAFIGAVHKAALDMYGLGRLVGGVFSRSLEKSRERAAQWGLDKNRVYRDYREMLEAEAGRPERPDFVVIVTPNSTHYPIAKLALQLGFHVACDKPLCISVDEAERLVALVDEKRVEFMVTYTYLGYPLVRQAREMVREGILGDIRVASAEYIQGWLVEDDPGSKQAAWRTDPALSGAAGAIGDIGTHAESLFRFITRQEISSLAANMDTFVPGRRLDDNGFVWFKSDNGAKGTIWASQVAMGRENGLSIRIYGSEGALEWCQEDPNRLIYSPKWEAPRILTRGGPGLHPHARRYTHTPSGHPEGYYEAFANLYDGFVQTILARRQAREPQPYDVFPDIRDGLLGMKFIHAAVRSNAEGNAWITL